MKGTWPRHMTIFRGPEGKVKPQWLIVADQMGNHLEVLDVSPTNGTLSPRQVISTPPQPSFVYFDY